MVWTMFLLSLYADVIIARSAFCHDPLWSQGGFVWWCSMKLFIFLQTMLPRGQSSFPVLPVSLLALVGPLWPSTPSLRHSPTLLPFFLLFIPNSCYTTSLIVLLTLSRYFSSFCLLLFLKTDPHYLSCVSGWKMQNRWVSPQQSDIMATSTLYCICCPHCIISFPRE